MTETPIFGRLATLAEVSRARILLVLERHPLTVGELCTVLQLPQSTVSRHLRVLVEEGWLKARSEGASREYRVSELDEESARLWQVVRDSVAAAARQQEDGRRLQGVLSERRTRSQEFFRSAAGQWDAVRRDLYGRDAELLPLLALLDPEWVVGDLGCGTGRTTAAVAPFVRKVIAVDSSAEMLAAAAGRLEGYPNVDVRGGELEALPVADGEVHAAVVALALQHVVDPAVVLTEVARVVKPGGRVLVVDMVPHDRSDLRERLEHVWQGFSGPQMESWLTEAGFGAVRRVELPADPEAKGPSLFAATAVRQ